MAILIKDPTRCPGCASKNSIRWDQHRCCECNTKVFKPSDDFVQLKRDWVISYWIYFPLNSSGYFRGWVHSTHLQFRDSDVKPNDPAHGIEKPSASYGTKKRHPMAAEPGPIGGG
jgi:hypothetical protein